jgi:hypothetical protein
VREGERGNESKHIAAAVHASTVMAVDAKGSAANATARNDAATRGSARDAQRS